MRSGSSESQLKQAQAMGPASRAVPTVQLPTVVDPSLSHPLTATTGALVIGGDYRGLGVVRSLGRHGIPVWVLTDEHRLAASSRYCRRSVPWPNGNDEVQLRFLQELCVVHHLAGWVLFPTADETAAFVARNYDELSKHFTLMTSPWEVFRWAYDKRLSNQLADRVGIDHPRTWRPTSRDELASIDATFPVILKPAYKVTLNRFTIAKAWQVHDRAELLAKYDEAGQYATPESVLVQELIPGGGETQLSFAALSDKGRDLVSVTARRTRQYPMDFGRASTFVESIVDDEVSAAARRLLQASQLSGLVEVEFKRDPRTGQLHLLDINPRVWGWHTLGRRAGVDFPYLLWRYAFHLPISETEGRPGIHWVRGMTDFPTAFKELRGKRLTVVDYAKSLSRPVEWAVFAFDDPWPAMIEVPLTMRLILRRGQV